MTLTFEELAYAPTSMGELVLRRRAEPRLRGRLVYEVKLDDEFLMSSLFTVGEIALANLGLAATAAAGCDVVVGGLGLGYTAHAALVHPRLQSLLVVDALAPVIDWHRRGIGPLASALTEDPRCTLREGDFFALAANAGAGFDPQHRERKFHAVLLDIDHSPRHWLDPGHAPFYSASGLRKLGAGLTADGVFAMWSNDPPDPEFEHELAAAFTQTRSEIVRFPNPYSGDEARCTIYLGQGPR
ncbi:MAG: spermidine synthase [Gammaproteobacteria bacterium]